MVKNIFFDFDGVILDSVDIKTTAFRQIYLAHGEDIADKAAKHHLDNGGISRYEKFKHCHKAFLGKNLETEEIERLAKRFSSLVFERVVNAPLTFGVLEFLQKYQKKLAFWIISGTPKEELWEICNKLNLKKYFQKIYGSPEKKTYWCEKIIKENSLNKGETIFIGDAITDYEASREVGISFLLRETEYNKDLFNDYRGLRILDFKDISNVLGLL